MKGKLNQGIFQVKTKRGGTSELLDVLKKNSFVLIFVYTELEIEKKNKSRGKTIKQMNKLEAYMST